MMLNLKIFQILKKKIIEKCKSDKPEILDNISSDGKLEENTEKLLIDLIKDLKNSLK